MTSVLPLILIAIIFGLSTNVNGSDYMENLDLMDDKEFGFEFGKFKKNCMNKLMDAAKDCLKQNKGNFQSSTKFDDELWAMAKSKTIYDKDELLVRITLYTPGSCEEYQKFLTVRLKLEGEEPDCDIVTENEICTLEKEISYDNRRRRLATKNCPRRRVDKWGRLGEKTGVNDYWFQYEGEDEQDDLADALHHISTHSDGVPKYCDDKELKFLAQRCENNNNVNFQWADHLLKATYGHYGTNVNDIPKSEFGIYACQNKERRQVIVHGTVEDTNPPTKLGRSIWWEEDNEWKLRCGSPCGDKKNFSYDNGDCTTVTTVYPDLVR